MGEHRRELLRHAARILRDVTPLREDCGLLCEARCCKGGDHDGMWLLPGERELLAEAGFLSIRETADGDYAICQGNCSRDLRPISCRIFPYFPIPVRGRGGRCSIRVMPDTRALSLCPLFSENAPEITPAFRHAVHRAGRLLLRNRKLRKWLAQSSDYITDIARVRELLKK